jgi:hypothetical protein
MTESHTAVEQKKDIAVQRNRPPAGGPSLAAALAAALLEYQHYVEQRNGNGRRTSAGDNWRFMGRIQQLRG